MWSSLKTHNLTHAHNGSGRTVVDPAGNSNPDAKYALSGLANHTRALEQQDIISFEQGTRTLQATVTTGEAWTLSARTRECDWEEIQIVRSQRRTPRAKLVRLADNQFSR